MILDVTYKGGGYEIVLARGALKNDYKKEFDRRVLIVTDDGVPREYAETVMSNAKEAETVVLRQGEQSKSMANLEALLKVMLEKGFTRSDCVAAVGGGVVGDLAGFAAAVYMRGIDFYNFPTTLLSQVDSSIGGKTAVDLCGVKNVVGAFKRPKKVVIDPDVLKTLDARQFASGMAEALKMALTSDEELFRLIEKDGSEADLETVISRALAIKRAVVEEDETEKGLRRVLNFGHTVGHGIEAQTGLLHGECVALGMIPMCAPDVRARLMPVLEKLGLPTRCAFDAEEAFRAALHDKKSDGEYITAVVVNEIGRFEFCRMTKEELRRRVFDVPGAR